MLSACRISEYYIALDKKCINIHNVLFSMKLYVLATHEQCLIDALGPGVQSVVSLTSSLRVISLTVLADSIYNILIFFAEKM